MSKWLKISLITASACLLVVIIIALCIFVPYIGSSKESYWGAGKEFNISSVQKVYKQANKDFVILELADTQLWMANSDNKEAYNLIKRLVDKEKPDLITIVGDVVSGITAPYLAKEIIGVMEKIGLPWCPILGNHDIEITNNGDWLSKLYEEAEHCLFQRGPSNLYGWGNYAVNVVEKQDDKEQIVKTLFFFDNGRYHTFVGEDGEKQEAEVNMSYEQIAWYKWNVDGIAKSNGGVRVPSFSHTHFQLPEYVEAMNACGFKSDNYPEGQDAYVIPEEFGFGYNKYYPRVTPAQFDSKFFDVAKEYGTEQFFFGHEHENCGSIKFEGVQMTFVMKSGPSPAPWNNAVEYGGTIVKIGSADTNYAVSDLYHTVDTKL